jgi:hypothetical protein
MSECICICCGQRKPGNCGRASNVSPEAGCERVLSENLADGAVHAGVRIENPFAAVA